MLTDWRPQASIQTLQARARLLGQVRQFFADRGVLEVETPILSRAGVTDPNLKTMTTHCELAGSRELFYMQTSPEFSMKRLLVAGSGPIYQISRVFRDGECGRLHNPEFTLLEWYRPGYNHCDLMEEIEEFLALMLDTQSCDRLSYADVFHQFTGVDPHRASAEELKQAAARQGLSLSELAYDRDDYLELLMSHGIAAGLGTLRPTIVFDYPPAQSALAKLRAGYPPVAERFEVFVNGIELANGFHELTDPVEQCARFQADNERRKRLGLPTIPIDDRLIAALDHGLPECAGVALGFDRLAMLTLEVDHIAKVLAFPIDRA